MKRRLKKTMRNRIMKNIMNKKTIINKHKSRHLNQTMNKILNKRLNNQLIIRPNN